tara:strand:+ start:895 stop:1827 length:933 start_codon:yes stop_codon:yes gene_type:complete
LSSIVVLGSGSFLGSILINKISSDILIKAVVRKIPRDANKSTKKVQWIKVDTISATSLKNIFKKGDIIINLIYIRDDDKNNNINLVNDIIEACIFSKVSRFIHCSSASVFGDVRTRNVNELTICNPKTDYEKIKLNIEELILKSLTTKIDVGILRPTAIVGYGGKNLKKLTNSLIYGNKIINYLRTCVLGSSPMHLVSAQNVVEALIFLALFKKRLNGNIFIVSEDESIDNNFKKVQEILIEELGLKSSLFPYIYLPKILQSLLFKILDRSDLNVKRIYDSKKIIKYGFKPKDTFKNAIKEFLNSIKNYY